MNALALPELYAELARTGLVRRLLELARDEDFGGAADAHGADVTSRATLDEGRMGEAQLRARVAGRIAGLAVARDVLAVFGPRCTFDLSGVQDGETVERQAVLGTVRGPLAEILAAERTLLNLISRMSGIATRTAEFVAAMERGTAEPGKAKLFDTRKTTPGLRVLEKYAVRCGGGYCHRMGLYDAVLIKDNHIAGVEAKDLPELVAKAAARAREQAAREGRALGFIEVEVDTLEQLRCLLEAGHHDPVTTLRLGGTGPSAVDVILLDNMNPRQLRQAAGWRDKLAPGLQLEASGGVSLKTVRAIARTGVNRISAGSLTHSAVALDIGLDIRG